MEDMGRTPTGSSDGTGVVEPRCCFGSQFPFTRWLCLQAGLCSGWLGARTRAQGTRHLLQQRFVPASEQLSVALTPRASGSPCTQHGWRWTD